MRIFALLNPLSVSLFLCFSLSLIVEIQEYKHRQVALIKCLKAEIQSGEGVDTDKKNCNPLVKKENGNDAGLPCCS
jgi:hypothetical protein